MADYTLACDTVVVINSPRPKFKIKPPAPSLVQVIPPDFNVVVKNPPRLIAKIKKPNTKVIVLPVAGPPGQDGQPGTDSFYYEHTQTLPSAGWSVTHNLGKLPNVSVIIGGETIGVAVHHVDLNTLYIPFAIPVTGKVICS